MTMSPAAELFNQLDTNHDGVLTKEEFAAIQARQGQAFRGEPTAPQMMKPGAVPMLPTAAMPRQQPVVQPVAIPAVVYPGQHPGLPAQPCLPPYGALPQQAMGGSMSPMPGGGPRPLPSIAALPSLGSGNQVEPEKTAPLSVGVPPVNFPYSSVSGSPNGLAGNASPLPGPQEKSRSLRSPSPMPGFMGGADAARGPLALLDRASPTHEPERTYPRIHDDAPEASFEHKIQMLDQKENHLQALQMKMIAEQAQNSNRELETIKRFIQDLKVHQEGLQADMAAVRESLGLTHNKIDDHARYLDGLKGPHATADERIKYLETVVGDSFNKHEKLLKGLRESHDTQGKELNDVKSVTMHHASFEQRMEYLERTTGDSFEKHARELKALQDSHQKHLKDTDDIKAHTIHHSSFEQRMEFLEKLVGDNADRHSKDLKFLKDSHDKHVQDLSSIHHASVPERLSYVEKLLGESADKHAKELSNLKAAHDKHATDVAGLKAAQAHQANMEERVNYIEKIMGDSADKHMAEVQALKDQHAKHALELTGVKAAHGNQARMEDRVSYLEKMIGDSAAKHVQELEAMKAHYNGYMARFDKQSGSHATSHAGLKERVDQIEQKMGLTHDNHSGELSALKDSNTRHSNAVTQYAQDMEGMKISHQQLNVQLREALRRTQDLETGHAQHKVSLEGAMAHLANGMPVHDRVKKLEALMGETLDRHHKELSDLKNSHGHHSKVLEGVNLSTKERLDAIERVLAFATDEKIRQTDEALKTTFNMYEQMRSGRSR